jgi:TRAP-type C4-dicarboxylate transport system permease small subunit
MRKALDLLYLACGVLGGVFLALIGGVILYQVFGRNFGYGIPGVDDLAALFLVAAAFLSLAYTFRAGGHIRVNLLRLHLPPSLRRLTELWSLAFGSCLMGFLSYYTVELAWESYLYGDRAIGQLPILMWIPQGAAALGLLAFTISFVDDFVAVLRGDKPSYGEVTELDLQSEG